MLMLCSVPLAFVGTQPARGRAGIQHCNDRDFVRARSSGPERTGSKAGIGTVEIKANALPQLRDHLLCKRGIGTGNAGLSATVTLLDAGDQCLVNFPLNIRMQRNYLTDLH